MTNKNRKRAEAVEISPRQRRAEFLKVAGLDANTLYDFGKFGLTSGEHFAYVVIKAVDQADRRLAKGKRK